MTRVLVLCTHNSARSQMGEGLLRALAVRHDVPLDVHSAGTEATFVKPPAVTVMSELGVDLSAHTSKTLFDVPDPWNFDFVITVCDAAAEACPVYPAKTTMRHYPFVDPSGGSLERWRAVRDQMNAKLEAFVLALREGRDVPASYERTPVVEVA